MKKARVYASFSLDVEFYYPKQVNIYIDNTSIIKNPEEINILILQESFFKDFKIWAIQNQDKYDYLFTYFDDVLSTIPKSTFFRMTNTWIRDYSFPEKIEGVSTIVGGKGFLLGHKLRLALFQNRNRIIYPNRIYISSHYRIGGLDYNTYDQNLILGDNKSVLFDTKYHLAIENVSINNLFSEKIIDCFQTKTMPIYWGCTNIGKFFNEKGIIIVKNLEEMIVTINSLGDQYESNIDAIEENYELSKKYTSYNELLQSKLNEILK